METVGAVILGLLIVLLAFAITTMITKLISTDLILDTTLVVVFLVAAWIVGNYAFKWVKGVLSAVN